MRLGKAEQDSMEVDNLCNRLVDQLHSMATNPGDDLHLDLDEGSSGVGSRGGVQVEAVVERRVEECGSGGEAIVEQRLVRVESFGHVPEEELENALNVGKELFLAHTAHSAASPSAPSTTAAAVSSAASFASSNVIASSTTTVTAAASIATSVSSTSSQPQGSAKPSHERRPSASKIPRFHKRTDSREEKSVLVSSDSNPGESVVQSSSSTSTVSSSPHAGTSESSLSGSSGSGRSGSGVKAKDSGDSVKNVRSKIPLSQKIPSPTASFRDSKATKSATSPSSPRPSAPSATSRSLGQAKGQPNPVPRARTSIHKSDHVAPPAAEVVEIARPSVKKRTSLNQKGDRNAAMATGGGGNKENRGGGGDKSVIVQDLKTERGGEAKLVIEKQSNLRKKIQTVHARKVPHPPRQIAEALDTDACDSPPADHSSTGPSDMEHSGVSSQEDEVFSDESLRLHAGRNHRSRSPHSLVGSAPSPSTFLQQASETYQHMAASRSSLDDSALQLAAERHDDLIPSWESRDAIGYSTGSLRSRRSLKMRNLMEVFEKGASGPAQTSHSSEESADMARLRDRSDSTSGSTTISVGSQDREHDTDDDIFHPPCSPRLPPSSLASRRSRSREKAARQAGQPSPPHRRTSQSPTARRPSAGRGDDSALRRRRPSPASRAPGEDRTRTATSTRTETSGVGLGRPPRYRSASRGRTYSDSSTSESDNTQHLDSTRNPLDSPSRPRGLPRGRVGGRQEEGRMGRGGDSGGGGGGGEEEEEGQQRRGSIKELRQLFEKSDDSSGSGVGRDSGSEASPPIPVRRSIRTRSVSPAGVGDGSCSPSAVSAASMMRRSMEIPSSGGMSGLHKQRDTPLTSQPLRLGPKPFYGSKK